MKSTIISWDGSFICPSESRGNICLVCNKYFDCSSKTRRKWAASWQNQQNGLGAQWRLRSAICIRQVWSEASLCASWIAKDPSFLHADSEDADQTGQTPRLICYRCPGWSESLLGPQFNLFVLSCYGSNVIREESLYFRLSHAKLITENVNMETKSYSDSCVSSSASVCDCRHSHVALVTLLHMIYFCSECQSHMTYCTLTTCTILTNGVLENKISRCIWVRQRAHADLWNAFKDKAETETRERKYQPNTCM